MKNIFLKENISFYKKKIEINDYEIFSLKTLLVYIKKILGNLKKLSILIFI